MGDVAVAAACCALSGMGCWLLLGGNVADARREIGRWVSLAEREAELLRNAAEKMLITAGEAFGLGARRRAIDLGAVSEMIDVVRLGLSAGLSFDAALDLYCASRDGPLASRMSEAHMLWQTGVMTREEALLEASRATGVRAMEGFAMAVGQALRLGAPLGDTLARQSREMRAAHRAEVERQIERAPVKLLIPTGTLILPALLVSIIGPLLAAGGML